MVNKNIQMKKREGNAWDNLYPISLTQNIFNNNGDSLTAILESVNEFVNTKASQTDLTTVENTVNTIFKTSIYVESFKKNAEDTSDSERVQRAVDSLTENQILHFAPILYTFKKAVLIDHSNIILNGHNAKILIEGNINAFESFSETRPVNTNISLTRLRIENFHFNGINKNGKGIAMTGIARGSNFTNLRFDNLELGLFLTGAWSFSITDCFFNNSNGGILLGDTRFGFHNGSEQTNAYTIKSSYFTQIKNSTDTARAIHSVGSGGSVLITGCTCELNNFGFEYEKTNNLNIKESYFESIAPIISTSKGYAIVLGGSDIVRDWSIKDCLFHQAVIQIKKAKNGLFDENTQSGAIGRMLVADIDTSQITGNKFVGRSKSFLFSETGGKLDFYKNSVFSGVDSINIDKPITLTNSWVTYQENVRGVLRSTLTSNGFVYLDGAVEGGTAGLTNFIGIIDENQRPQYIHHFMCSDIGGNPVGISIGLDGKIVVRTAGITSPIEIHVSYKNKLV